MPSLWASSAMVDVLARGGLACALSFLLVLLCAPRCIRWLRGRCGEKIKSASAQLDRLHSAKQGTPTMGGVLVVGSFLTAFIVCSDYASPTTWIVALVAAGLCALGCADDWTKLRTARRGLRARTKLALQLAIAVTASGLLFLISQHTGAAAKLHLPLMGSFDMGWWFVPWAALVIVGSSNAVNLTDGLDGLAGGCLLLAVVAMSLAALLTGQGANATEMTVAGAALAGAIAAFLCFNLHPAKVFLGDAGSLPLGGLLGLTAIIARQELLLVLVGGVFVIEALSVLVQISWFRTTGRRAFRCAPLHHHFQFAGMPEKAVVARFWLAGAVCAACGLVVASTAANQPAETSSIDRGPVAASPQTLPSGAGQEMLAPERTISMRSVSN
jgi:phospho-N-acetylmuramoyl-pentapeptide-transferase